jgi:hypothetical protein
VNVVYFEDALRRSKTRKAAWLDGPNMELLMYASEKMEKNYLTMCGYR